MPTFLTPWPLQPIGSDSVTFTASDLRQFNQAIWAKEGVLTLNALNVTQRASGANLSVDVSAGQAVVKCDSVAPNGMYVVTATASSNVVLPAAPGSGTRTHFIIAQVNDNQDDGSGLYTWKTDVAADGGTGAVVPDSALKLATVSVAHGQSSVTNANINDVRAFALTQGVALPQQEGRSVLVGSYTVGAPVRRESGYVELKAPADGKISLGTPAGTNCVIDLSVTPVYHDGTAVNMARGWTPEIHTGGTSDTGQITIQCRQLSNNLPVTDPIWVGFSWTMQFQ